MSARNRGMSLLEVMVAVGIFTIVMGTLFGISLSLSSSAAVQNIQINTQEEGRRVMLTLVPELMQAARSSINWDELPGEVLEYRIAQDLDGNGTAVSQIGALELSPPRTVRRDLDDLNGDGLTTSQLVLVDGDLVRILANGLSPETETTDANGVLGPAQDLNGNGQLDRGFWVTQEGEGVRLHFQVQGQTRRGLTLRRDFEQHVQPRN